MSKMIWLDPDGKTLRFGNEEAKGTIKGANIGEVYKEVDGYLVWVPPQHQGAWESPHLRLVADYLDEQNAPWDAEIREFFENQESREIWVAKTIDGRPE